MVYMSPKGCWDKGNHHTQKEHLPRSIIDQDRCRIDGNRPDYQVVLIGGESFSGLDVLIGLGEFVGGDGVAGAVLQDAVDGFPVLFAVREEVTVLDAETDEVGAGHLEAVVFVDEFFRSGMVQAGGVGFGLGSVLIGGLVALLYQHQVVEIVRDAGEGGEDGEDD